VWTLGFYQRVPKLVVPDTTKMGVTKAAPMTPASGNDYDVSHSRSAHHRHDMT
jgi:hypothetical protein